MTMRFCLISTQKHWGGGETLLLDIAHELAQASHTVSWVVRNKSEVASKIAQQNGKLLHRVRGRGRNPYDWRQVGRSFNAWQPDVVILNDTHAVMLNAAARWCCRGSRPLRLAYKHTVFPLRSKLKYRLLTDKLVCVSQAAKQIVVDGGLPSEHAEVIYGGCKIPETSPGAAYRIRKELQIAESEKLLVCIGNLLSCKGHIDAVQAMSRMSHTDCQLIIAGEGDQRHRLEAQIERLGLRQRVKLLGYRHDTADLLQAADVIVHPSLAEGLSLVLIQAQMLSKPIVATPVGGALEVISVARENSKCSFKAKPSDPASLAYQIDQALYRVQSPTREWLDQLQQTAAETREQFGIERNADELACLAARLIDKPFNFASAERSAEFNLLGQPAALTHHQ